jgi:ergothioneine biosynthesis protein EgtB
MDDVSPARWHLAHTTWFFETFALARWESGYRAANREFQYLFNSYYQSVGAQFPRSRRGLLTRPTVAEVFDYREAVDERIKRLLATSAGTDRELLAVVELGINHEQQHQELILTDIKHVLSCNPLCPAYRRRESNAAISKSTDVSWSDFDGGVVEIGHNDNGFAFDNESPRHKVFLQPYRLANRLVTNSEYLRFVDDGGYRDARWWLSLGWTAVQERQWTAPLYWVARDGGWSEFTLAGLRSLEPAEPVCHVSYFEADAFARWSGRRLPTEAEWEHAAGRFPLGGSFVEGENYHPRAAQASNGSEQMYGELWQWTASPYVAYPGYRAPEGALGEYNGKFMCNQYVLRGGSCATPASHIRPTYRNFFPPDARWQFTGIRQADDLD